MAVFGEFPKYEPGQYTFLLDYVAWGARRRDGTSQQHARFPVPDFRSGRPHGRQSALDTIAHEFFHNWNVERIRPVGLEPFDFTRENVTCCLWLAEGFTQYYGPLLRSRALAAGVVGGGALVSRSAARSSTAPAAAFARPSQMSEHAPFADARRGRRSRRSRAARSSRTTPTAPRSRSASICRCASCPRASCRSTTTCGCCGPGFRQAGRTRGRATWPGSRTR